MKKIDLTKGQFAIIDDEDFEKVSQFKWHLGTRGYAIRKDSTRKQVSMHRFIMGFPDMDIDHKNQNKLDNRKSNFRFCTDLGNSRNRKAPKTNTSGYKGVSWVESRKRWVAYCQEKQIGYFKSKEEAAYAYNIKAQELFGEFAHLNKII